MELRNIGDLKPLKVWTYRTARAVPIILSFELSTQEWIGMQEKLCRPLGHRPDNHQVVEVAACWGTHETKLALWFTDNRLHVGLEIEEGDWG